MFASKHVSVEADGADITCSLSSWIKTDTSSPEELTSYCGVTKVPGVAAYEVAASGWSDWGETDSICQLLHDSYVADPPTEIAIVHGVAGATQSYSVIPQTDIPFGSEAGVQTWDLTLSVVGDVTDGTVAP